MSFKTKEVSKVKIKPIAHKLDKKPIKGEDWFPTRFPNVFILAKKNSGKTTVVSNILDHCAGKNTKMMFLVSTVDKDPTWVKIVKKWKETHEVFTNPDLFDDGKINIIHQWLDEQKEQLEEDDDKQEGGKKQIVQKKQRIPMVGAGGQLNIIAQEIANIQESKPKKPRIITPDYIIVLDDLGDTMRNKAVTQLLKTNRHYKTMVILSSQSLNDLQPSALLQLDYMLVFGRTPVEKIQELHDKLKLDIPIDEFYALYQDATKEQYQFFYINRAGKEDEFRKGFNYKYTSE